MANGDTGEWVAARCLKSKSQSTGRASKLDQETPVNNKQSAKKCGFISARVDMFDRFSHVGMDQYLLIPFLVG